MIKVKKDDRGNVSVYSDAENAGEHSQVYRRENELKMYMDELGVKELKAQNYNDLGNVLEEAICKHRGVDGSIRRTF